MFAREARFFLKERVPVLEDPAKENLFLLNLKAYSSFKKSSWDLSFGQGVLRQFTGALTEPDFLFGVFISLYRCKPRPRRNLHPGDENTGFSACCGGVRDFG